MIYETIRIKIIIQTLYTAYTYTIGCKSKRALIPMHAVLKSHKSIFVTPRKLQNTGGSCFHFSSRLLKETPTSPKNHGSIKAQILILSITILWCSWTQPWSSSPVAVSFLFNLETILALLYACIHWAIMYQPFKSLLFDSFGRRCRVLCAVAMWLWWSCRSAWFDNKT